MFSIRRALWLAAVLFLTASPLIAQERQTSQLTLKAPRKSARTAERRATRSDSAVQQTAWTATRAGTQDAIPQDLALPAWQQPPRHGGSPVRSISHEAIFDDDARHESVPIPEPDEHEGVQDGDVIIEGDMGLEMSDEFSEHAGGCGADCDGCEECDKICIPRFWLDETSVFGGVHAFKGPLDQGQNGNFGFHEGVNFAGPLIRFYDIGYQAGANFHQSNFEGTVLGEADDRNRNQTFFTVGLFKRALCGCGLQGGAVYDRLEDRYYVDYQVSQVRGEISYLLPAGNEFGFWGAFGTKDAEVTIGDVDRLLSPTDMYVGFYRRNLTDGGQGRLWGGGTGDNDGIIGADFRVPLTNRWDLNGGFNYLIPQQEPPAGAVREESWGLTVNLVWYPGRRNHGTHDTPYRALFPVADNNVFMVDNLPR